MLLGTDIEAYGNIRCGNIKWNLCHIVVFYADSGDMFKFPECACLQLSAARALAHHTKSYW